MEYFNRVVDDITERAGQIKAEFLSGLQGKNPVIFGAGNCGHKLYGLLQTYGIAVSCFWDNRLHGNTDAETGMNIIKPQERKAVTDDTVVLVGVDGQDVDGPIYRQLRSLGFDEAQIRIVNRYFHWMPLTYLQANLEKYRKAYQLLADELSRQVYLAKMKNLFLMTDMAEVVSPGGEEYFDKKILLTDNEMFIDCGGFDGDTAARFAEQCGGRYRGIVIFEPEACKKAEIKRNMGANPYELYPFGVWSKRTRLYFNALGTESSHISERESGGCMIETASLDETVYDKRPTYIKMDIEGAEQEALKGGRKIIQTYKPKLAVCIYHKPEDLFDIPIMIKEMMPVYELYVRQYTNAWYDTVLYAIPKC